MPPWERYQKQEGPWTKYTAPDASPEESQITYGQGVARFAGKGLSFGGSETERAYAKLGVPPAYQADEMTPSEMAKAAGAYSEITPEVLAAEKHRGAQQMQAFGDKNPVSAVAAEVAGAIANPIGLVMGAGAAHGAKAIGAAVPRLSHGVGRYATHAFQGGATGAGYGALTNPEEPIKGASIGAGAGAALGVAVPAIAEGAGKVIGKTVAAFKNQAPKMSQEQFKAAAQAAYKVVDDAGVNIDQAAFTKFSAGLPDNLTGYHPKVTPGASNLVAALQDEAAKGPVTLSTLDKLRSIASGASVSSDANEARLAGEIAGKIDDFVEALTPQDLLGGQKNAQTAVDALHSARDLWRTYSKKKVISDIVDVGENLNDTNWVKGRFRAIVKKPSLFNRYTADEKKLISDIARTGTLEKIAKLIPWRGIQMTTTYAEPLAQESKINALQSLISSGGVLPQARGLSPEAARFLAGSPVPILSPFSSSMIGGSNQRP